MDKQKFHDFESYFALFPEETQALLRGIRRLIQEAAPDAEETISYQIPTFKLNKKNVVHFAAYPKHIGFYPGASGIAHFQDELSRYKHAKGSVQFPLNEPIPLDLIEKIVKFRVKETLEKDKK